MKSSSVEHWSLMRSLAFLAATFAIVFAALLPSAVAASPAIGSPVMLCSGDRIMVVQDADGASRPEKPSGMDSQTCASCVLASFTALPPPPPPHPAAPPRIVAVRAGMAEANAPPPASHGGPRPPSTAPPSA